ncbi:MAG: carbon-nitrogen family hydrolase [Dialister sp.]|nr:carbon-nitrogen family hydrolase [Dialister sp.]
MKLTLGLIQAAIRLGNAEYNYEHMEMLLADAARRGAEVLVLPEMWNVGFFPSRRLHELADPAGKQTQALFSRMAKKHGLCIVGGSVAIQEGSNFYNRAYVMDENGECISSYDKIHGFSPSREPEVFQMGSRIPFFKVKTMSASMALCYDIRFPELIRREALGGADIIFVPAAWPAERLYHWDTLLKARAIENQIFLCAVNQGGFNGKTEYAGHSLLLDPWGEVIAQSGAGEEVLIASIDADVLQDVRGRMRVFGDRRDDVDVVFPAR